jgi:hypothetical protein
LNKINNDKRNFWYHVTWVIGLFSGCRVWIVKTGQECSFAWRSWTAMVSDSLRKPSTFGLWLWASMADVPSDTSQMSPKKRWQIKGLMRMTLYWTERENEIKQMNRKQQIELTLGSVGKTLRNFILKNDTSARRNSRYTCGLPRCDYVEWTFKLHEMLIT